MNSNNKRTATIHGVTVTQMNLQGNWYTPVDGRVKIAEQADPAQVRREGASYHVVSVQIMQVGDRWAYHCMVEYPAGSGVVKPGTDFIDMKDNAGIAKAETSAIGRALGLHGIACEESIASAEEVERATDNTATAPQRTPQANLTAQPKHAPASPSADTSGDSQPAQTRGTQDTPAVDPLALTHASALDQKRLSGQLAARFLAAEAQANFLHSVTGRDIDLAKVRDGKSDLSVPELARLNERLTRITANGNGGGRR